MKPRNIQRAKRRCASCRNRSRHVKLAEDRKRSRSVHTFGPLTKAELISEDRLDGYPKDNLNMPILKSSTSSRLPLFFRPEEGRRRDSGYCGQCHSIPPKVVAIHSEELQAAKKKAEAKQYQELRPPEKKAEAKALL